MSFKKLKTAHHEDTKNTKFYFFVFFVVNKKSSWFPSSCLGIQSRKLQLPESRSWSFAYWVPNLEIGNQRQ
jgi:hypothetical protein